MDKAQLRTEIRQRLRDLSLDAKKAQSAHCVEMLKGELTSFLDQAGEQKVISVAWFSGTDNEVDLRELHPWLRERGIRSLLPKVEGDGRDAQMRFYEVENLETQLVKGAYGIEEPIDDLRILPMVPFDQIDIWVCPGIAFDGQGNRLGQGGGFYDRALSLRNYDARVWGVAFDCQCVDKFEVDDHDERMERVFS